MPVARKKNNWPAIAGRLAAVLPRERLHPRAVAAGEARRGPWAVAFSGGADSLALLLLLWAHYPRRRAQLVALHFDHRLRGRESTVDARFCLAVCDALGVRLQAGEWREAHRGASEAEARAARHAFFSRELTALRSRTLWLAHQQDDIAETMLMRLARGSGTGGLAAPRPVQPMPRDRNHLRPLLTLKKAELLAALRSAGATWREDSTNVCPDYLRNRIRGTVIPVWNETNPGRDALAGAALSREKLEEDDAALEAWAAELAPLGPDRSLVLQPLAGRPRALWRRALHRWLLAQPHGSDLSRQGFEQLLAMAERGTPKRFSLGANGFAVIRRGVLRFESTGRRPRSSRKTTQ
ncbi:MAG TPA: tRNA lysidine(34) synthetase TilS [Opitutaceae bacterium]